MPNLDLFIPFTKSEEQSDGSLMVYGTLTQEQPDRSGEVLDYAKSKPYFKAWSESVHKDSKGKSFGNCRYMHQLKIAGHGTQIVFNDAQKRIDIATKISDPTIVREVRDGELTGYSIGGKYVDVKKVGNLTRYIADPNEYSVVDRPCVPGATFQYFKADGTSEVRKFAKYEASVNLTDLKKASDEIARIVQEGILGDTNPGSFGQPKEQDEFDALENAPAVVSDGGVNNRGVQDDPAVATTAGISTEKPCADCGCDADDCKCAVTKREFSDKKRKDLAESGKALPDGSFPIENEADLHNAITAHGRASDPDAAKQHIESRAKAMGMEGALPDAWKASGVADGLKKLTSNPSFSSITDALTKAISALEQLGQATTENKNMATFNKSEMAGHIANLKKALGSAMEHCDKCEKSIAGPDSAESEGGKMQGDAGRQNAASAGEANSTNGIATDIGKGVTVEQVAAIVEDKMTAILEKVFGSSTVTENKGARSNAAEGNRAVAKGEDTGAVAKSTVSDEDDLPPAPGSQNEILTPAVRKAAVKIQAQHEIPEDVQKALAGVGR